MSFFSRLLSVQAINSVLIKNVHLNVYYSTQCPGISNPWASTDRWYHHLSKAFRKRGRQSLLCQREIKPLPKGELMP